MTTISSRSSNAWHSQGSQASLEQLQSDPQRGLTAEVVQERLEHYGPNELQGGNGRSTWQIFLDQFTNIMLVMLIAVAVISGILEFVDLQQGGGKGGLPFKDTIAIFSIVILNGALGFLQESRAEQALAALKKLSSPKVRVIRGGDLMEVDAPQLVPGDVMLIEAGSQLCADGQLLEAANLQIRESALTGEAHAVLKNHELVLAENTPLGDRLNMVFTGTEVIQGRGKVLVTDTGMATELGKIAQMLQEVKDEETPLQKRLSNLGNVLVSSSLALVALVVAIGLLRGGDAKELLEVSLSMAVAVVPEGLPAVITVTLAIGTQRMVRRNALIRKLAAVETLGSVDTICSDKTGTLTQNKMVVQRVETLNQSLEVTGQGYAPQGELIPPAGTAVRDLWRACVLCNDAVLRRDEQGEWVIFGDPTEGALLALAGKSGIFQETLENDWVRLGECPFSSERKRMSVICGPRQDGGGSYSMFTKGSPELVLQCCDSYQEGDREVPLEESQRRTILEQNNTLAAGGLRVLGFAQRRLDRVPDAQGTEQAEQGMTWLGLVGMLDAPRPEVKDAVMECRHAGIRTVMITGDHHLTARAIAEQLGITNGEATVLTGQELEQMPQTDLEQRVGDVNIYARVSPEHKLRIVRALQKQNRFVAMTGDGVNDAPALKQADIGIAMGITGTDVSKEASDMVLLDDNFVTIVAATEEGRVVYSNIRRFIKYILGSNVGEVITIAAAPILGLSGIPLTPLQILWMNLVTDGLPALALAMEPASPDVMNHRPFSPRESIFARGLGWYIIRIGVVFAILSISLMEWAYHSAQGSSDPESWKTMVFTTLCIAQMGHAISARSNLLSIRMNPLTNPYLWGAVVVTTVLQLMLIYVPPLREFFDTHVLTGSQLLLCLGFSSLMFIWVELEKVFIAWYQKRSPAPEA